MEEVIAFVERFAEAEKEAKVASYVADADAFQQRVQAAQEYFWNAPMGTLSLSLGQVSEPGDTEQNRRYATSVTPRRTLMVKQFRHSEMGDLYAAYTTHPSPKFAILYGEILYVTRRDGELKIVSRYGKGFPTGDAAISWEWAGGERIEDPGELADVRKLLPPQNAEQRADYDAA